MKRVWISGMITLLCASIEVFPQGQGSGAISGTVADPSGAVVPAAQVTVTQTATGVKRATHTNSAGLFSAASLPPGPYSITVTATGFKTHVERFTILADQILSFPVTLQIGEAAQTVTVEGASVHVNTEAPVLSQVVEQTRVVDLTLIARNAADLTLLSPGTISANGHGVGQGTTKQIPGGAEAIAVNGARPDQIAYNLDGASNEDPMGNTNNPFPFPDALQEFSVQTNSFGSQYGANAGAVVNVVTKSGTNNWHGDAFEFVRNRVFNARNFFAAARDPLKQNQYGGTVGGPIKKDSSFIFFGYQGTRLRTQNNASPAILPTVANLTGDFSNYATVNPANPKGKAVSIKNPTTGVAFAGDVGLPVDPVAVNFSKLLPIAQAGPDGRITFAAPSRQNVDDYVARFDQVVWGQDKLYGRFFLDRF